jgi:Holliday junction resolvasome RuvABC ATP-dependent DNA helicase subunit
MAATPQDAHSACTSESGQVSRPLRERPTQSQLLSALATERLALMLHRADLHMGLAENRDLRRGARALHAEARLAQRIAERRLRSASRALNHGPSKDRKAIG